jgi:putative peptidoglycan lipid II flippase
MVATGHFASRVAGLVRQRVVAHFFGQSTDAADAFFAAFRIPNFLQNLFGEGVLSASMIPEYTRPRRRRPTDDARRLAGASRAARRARARSSSRRRHSRRPCCVGVIVPGFEGARRCLADARSCDRCSPASARSCCRRGASRSSTATAGSCCPTAAPSCGTSRSSSRRCWPRARIAPERLVLWTCWGAVVGSVLQLAGAAPTLLAPHGRRALMSLTPGDRARRSRAPNFGPVFLSRGVVQISAFIDAMIASLLPVGAVAVISNAQTLYLLPVSLFGMSVAAAELPELSEEAGEADAAGAADAVRARSR